MADVPGLDVAVGTITGSWGGLTKYFPIAIILIILVIIGGAVFLWGYARKRKGDWNVLFRIRQEDKQRGTIYLDPIEIRGKRVTLSNGLRLIYLEKEILGKYLFPNLNHYTKPGVYDLIISADNRIFLIDGIKGIDEERKLLSVGIRYPGIDYSLEEVNRDHAKLNKLDRRSDLMAIVKAASIAVIAICLLVGLIVAGKYWLDAKDIDARTSEAELQLLAGIQDYQSVQIEQTNAMRLLIESLKSYTGNNNLRNALEVNTT